jgi:hypothetical protein
MASIPRWLNLAAGFAAIGLSALGKPLPPVSSEFAGISARNAFGLVSAPLVRPVAPPLPQVRLNGLTTILGVPRALLKVRFPGTVAVAAREESWCLRPGERRGEFELVEVDVAARRIKVSYAGILQVIAFDTSPPEPPTASPEPPLPPGLVPPGVKPL